MLASVMWWAHRSRRSTYIEPLILLPPIPNSILNLFPFKLLLHHLEWREGTLKLSTDWEQVWHLRSNSQIQLIQTLASSRWVRKNGNGYRSLQRSYNACSPQGQQSVIRCDIQVRLTHGLCGIKVKSTLVAIFRPSSYHSQRHFHMLWLPGTGKRDLHVFNSLWNINYRKCN